MPKCPICGKNLKYPNSSSHIRSKFHQEALRKKKEQEVKGLSIEYLKVNLEKKKSQSNIRKKSNLENHKDETTDEILNQLQQNLLDEHNYLKVSELEFLKGYEGKIVDSLVMFLKIHEYQIEFENLEEFFHIIDIILSFLSLDDISTILNRFEKDTLRYELKNRINDIDLQDFFATSYGFDLVVYLIFRYLRQEDLLEFLTNIEDLEDILIKSYYEVNDTDNNPTTITIEKALAAGLKNEDQEIYNNSVAIINSSGTFFEHLKKELLNTFRVNEFITLKLVGTRTNIYVKGQLFNQCKYLLLNIQKSRIKEYDNIGSIDEAVERLDASMHGREGRHTIVAPDIEFWGHCSNIQAWAENNYDTRILHRNLAFPLLKRLTEVGDPKAKKVYKDEIASRFQSGYPPVIEYIFAGNYLNALNKEEINSLVEEIDFEKFISQQYHRKQNLLLKFATLGSTKAKNLLSEQMKRQLQTAKLTEMRNILSRTYLTHLNKSDIMTLYQRFLKKKDKPGNEELKIHILGDFARLKIQGAKSLLKDQILITLSEQKTTVVPKHPRFRRRYRYTKDPILTHLKIFNKEELKELCDKYLSGIATEQYNEAMLATISRFSDLGISTAKDAFKKSLMNAIKEGKFDTLRRVATAKRLKTLTRQDIISLSNEIDFTKKFSQNPQVTLTLLERFYKSGYEKAKKIIRDSILKVLKNPKEEPVNPVLNKTFLKNLENDDIKKILETKDSRTVENLLTILQTTSKSNLRKKIVRFFTMVKEFSGELLSQKVKEALIDTEAESFHKLLKAKILTLLSQKDKDYLYDHPKCKLRNFVVSYEGNEYVVDARLNLDLRNKGIKDITKVKGLNTLTHLESLDLRDNHLTTIIGIGNLTKLRKLRIQGNNFSPQFIKHLGGLDRYGNAKYPQKFVKYSKSLEEGGITYITVGSKNLEVFGDELILSRLGIKKIEEIKGLSKIKSLHRLDLSHNQLENIKGLEKLTSLKILNLSHNQLRSTKGLEMLVNIEELRLYGNGIMDFPEREYLPHLKILDLDTRRKVSDHEYLTYLFQSLNMEDIKQVCREHNIRGYSRMRRDYLIRFTRDSLSDEEKRMVISNLEMKIINRGIDMAIRKIEHKEREFIDSIIIRNAKFNEIEIKFKGFNWETESYISITPKTINNPERDCDCRIGSNLGFCSHFWVGVIYSLKAGFFKLSDWTLTSLPPKLEERLSDFKIVTDSSNNKQLINEKDNSAFLVKNLNTRVYIQDAKLGKFERRQYFWENKIITYYLNTLKDIKIAPEKQKEETVILTSLLVRFSENMFSKYHLEKKNDVTLTGEVVIDSYLGLMLKKVFVEKSYPALSKSREKVTNLTETTEQQGIEGTININLNTIKDDLQGSWWHHISSENFIFIQQVPVIKDYYVNEGDILIHKQIKPGDRFPSVRYHVVHKKETKSVENAEVKKILINKLIQYVNDHECLPPSTHFVKEFKNGNLKINYTPSSHVKFSLSISPGITGVDRACFQRESRTVDAKLEVEEPQFGAPVENQWQIASESDPNKTYTVTKQPGGKWSCTCPHHIYRRATCKHILEAMRRQK